MSNIPNTKRNISQDTADGLEPAAPSESVRTVQMLSSTDTMVADLIKEQPTLQELERIKVYEHKVPNILELPEECKERKGREFRYRWLAKGKDLAAKLHSSGWVLCNRTNSPYILPHRFSSHGGVEKAGMLLAFMPERLARVREQRPAELSKAKVKHYTEDIARGDASAPISFYKPTDTGDDGKD